MQEYPLSGFQELIENPYKIDSLRNNFLTTAFQESGIDQEEDDAECFYIINSKSFPPVDERVGLDGWIRLSLHVHETIMQIDQAILRLLDEKQKEYYLKTTLSSVESLLLLLSKRNDLKKYPSIEQSLLMIKGSIISKYNLSDSNQGFESLNYQPKIQWLGKTNVLITLFYDLLNGQDKREPLINYPKNELKQFIANTFLDKDGNELSQATIDTIFTPSKGDKRAKIGDRIELPNKRVSR